VDEERHHADRVDDRQQRDERLEQVHAQAAIVVLPVAQLARPRLGAETTPPGAWRRDSVAFALKR
jgi:hypothetical protein